MTSSLGLSQEVLFLIDPSSLLSMFIEFIDDMDMINFTLSLSLLEKQFKGFNNYSSAFKLIALSMNHRFIEQKYDINHMAFINKNVGFYIIYLKWI